MAMEKAVLAFWWQYEQFDDAPDLMSVLDFP